MYALILLLASVTVPDQTIGGILFKIGIGFLRDSSEFDIGQNFSPEAFTLEIDGNKSQAWFTGVWQVFRYALDRKLDGSVRLAYRLNSSTTTSTLIENNRVTKVIETTWVEKTKRKKLPVYVKIILYAVERDNNVIITGTASGIVDTSAFHCCFIRHRIVDPRARKELKIGLACAMCKIQEAGTDFYMGGTSKVLDILHQSIRVSKLFPKGRR